MIVLQQIDKCWQQKQQKIAASYVQNFYFGGHRGSLYMQNGSIFERINFNYLGRYAVAFAALTCPAD